MSRHKWSDKVRAPNGDSRKVCEREGCEVICVSHHAIDPHGRQEHWKEWFRGTELIRRGGLTPVCEPLQVEP